MNSAESNSTQPRLVANLPEPLKHLLEMGKKFEKVHGQKTLKNWENMAKPGTNLTGGYINWYHLAYAFYILNELLSFKPQQDLFP